MASGSQNMTTYLAKGLQKVLTTNATNTDNLLYINTADTNITADILAATNSIAFTRMSTTGAHTTGHIVWLNAADIGTPFQLVVHDSSELYFWKRWKNTSNNTWGDWTKMKAGTADTWTTTRTFTVGATGKDVNGSANVSWSMNEIMGSSTSANFYRGDKTWSNTIIGPFNASSSGTARANINMVTVADQPNDFYLGNNNANKWSITSRASNESYNLNVYSTASGVSYCTRWEYSTGKFYMLHGAEVSGGYLVISQPDDHRDYGLYGTYKYTKAATIWSMGTAYKIAADGSGLGSLYGAAYAYQDQAYIGSKKLAGGHQFVWCENGVPQVALGNTGVWLKKAGGIYWDPYVESASDASDVSRIIQVASGCAGGTELQIYQANDATDCINLVTPKSIYLNSKEAFNVSDSWLRINENKKFTSGVYFGSSLVRTDGTLRAGSGSGSWTDITAGVVVGRIDSGEARLEARNGTHRVYLYCNSDGRAGLYGVRTDGTAFNLIYFANNSSAGTFYGNCTGSSASCTGNAATATKADGLTDGSKTMTSAYNKAGLAYADYTWLAGWNGYELRAVNKSQFAQASHTHSYLPLSGGQMTGTITMTTAPAAAATSTPTAISYGRFQCYGTLCINANTDNSGTEYVILTAGHGCSSSTSEGFWVGSNSAGCAYSITAPSFWISGAAGSNNCIQVGSGDANGNGGANWALRSWYGIGFMSGCTSVNNGKILAGVDCRYGYIYSARTYNAVWNDFAEFRESDITEPGRVLISNGKGQMVLCDRRLVAGAKIISDTFGCSVGESDSAKTPLGVAGRVLAYTYQNRDNYKVGDAVCAAPNGTVDIMTREEIKEYPDRIIGIVDEIPIYKRWEQYRTCKNENNESVSNKASDIEVKGRIWIYVK